MKKVTNQEEAIQEPAAESAAAEPTPEISKYELERLLFENHGGVQVGNILYGTKGVEGFFHRNFVGIVVFRDYYGLPVKKRLGEQSLSLDEWRAFAKENSLDPDDPAAMSAEILRAVAYRKRLEAIPDQELIGLDSISQYLNRPPADVMNWKRVFVDCPIQVPEGSNKWHSAKTSTRALRVWMSANQINFVPPMDHRAPTRAPWGVRG